MTTGVNFLLDVEPESNKVIVSWDKKSPKVESEMTALGGSFEDFNAYRFRFDMETVKKINSYAKPRGGVKVTQRAKDSLALLKASVVRARSLSGGNADADVSDLLWEEAPETAKALRPYQRAGVQFMLDSPSTLLADEPGAGKTLSSIATMISAGVTGDILVLAPAAAIQVTWPAEVARWSPNDEIITVTGPRAKREAALARLRFLPKEGKRRWVLCNIEMAKVKYHKPFELDGKAYKGRYEYAYPELFFLDYSGKMKNARKWEAIIVDESHRALITKKTRSHEQTQTRCGLGKLSTVEGGRRIAISGTPFRGKLENLWGTLNWLFPETYTAYWHWVNEWFSTESNFFGGSKVTSLDGSEAEFYRSIEPFTLRRTKREISPDLPPKAYAGFVPEGMEIEEEGQERGLVGHWLEMKPKQQRAYYQMVEQALATLENGTLVANGVLAEMTRLKQFASCFGKLERKMDSDGYEVDVFKPELPSNKLDWLLEFFTELGIDKDGQEGPDARKVVVASQFTSMINLFEREINKRGIKTLKVVGGVSAEDRIAAVKEFQTDSGPQVFLLNTLAGGVSLTLDRADDIVILDETFIPDDQEQVEDRVHRVSRMHNVTVHYVRSLGTIEEKIARLTFGRNINTKQILDGERGVEFARQILGN
jgi:SNF2 family DNA or RNA helicase